MSVYGGNPLISRLSSIVNSQSTTLANSGLTIPLQINQLYMGRAVVFCNDDVATDGLKFQFTGSIFSSFRGYARVFETGAADVVPSLIHTSALAVVTSTITITLATGNCLLEVDFMGLTNAAGNLALQFAQETASGGTASMYINSFLTAWPVNP